MESTVLHGIKQIYTVASALHRNNSIRNPNVFYGIIVTYKDYFVGDGKRFWNEVSGEYFENWTAANNIQPKIPSENFFIISVEEYDYLIAGIKENPSDSLIGILERVKQDNQNPQSYKFMLKQHLEGIWGRPYCLDYLSECSRQFFDVLESRFPETTG